MSVDQPLFRALLYAAHVNFYFQGQFIIIDFCLWEARCFPFLWVKLPNDPSNTK